MRVNWSSRIALRVSLAFWITLLSTVFDWLYFIQCLTSFFFFFHLLHLCAQFLINIGEILSINSSANVFVIGDFNVRHKDWLTYSGETGRPGELCYNFSISNGLIQMVNFPTRILDCDSHSPAFSLYFFLLALVFLLQWLSLHWEILIMLLSQFPSPFQLIHNEMPRFIA